MQSIVIIKKNNKIEELHYTDQQVLDIFQTTNEFVQDLYKYETDQKLGTYYYQAVAKLSWILTYMQYNIRYKNDSDPMYQFNLALNNLYGFVINEQGKALVVSKSSEIRSYLDEIVSAHRESRLNDRDQAILELKQYLLQNLSINISDLPPVDQQTSTNTVTPN